MHRFGKPKLLLLVWGDWSTVISAREYRDLLLDQSPDSAEDRDYREYRIPCSNTQEIVAAYHAFAENLRLKCGFAMEFDSGDGVKMFTQSVDGYSSDGAFCNIDFDMRVFDHRIAEAAHEAIAVLKKGLG